MVRDGLPACPRDRSAATWPSRYPDVMEGDLEKFADGTALGGRDGVIFGSSC
jgi:hypothetical protein